MAQHICVVYAQKFTAPNVLRQYTLQGKQPSACPLGPGPFACFHFLISLDKIDWSLLKLFRAAVTGKKECLVVCYPYL